MKNILLNLPNALRVNRLFSVLMLFVLVGLTSCEKDKDPTVTEKLVSTWDIKSFTLDGVELKGSVVTSSKILLKAHTDADGDFEWNIHYIDGTTDITSGDYTVNETDKEIKFDAENGESLEFEFELDGNNLELSGTIDGERYLLKAKRD